MLRRDHLFSAFGTLIQVRASRWTFLSCVAKKGSERRPPHETRRPLRCGQSSRRLRDSLRSNILAETPPRLFLAPACFKGGFKPRATRCDTSSNFKGLKYLKLTKQLNLSLVLLRETLRPLAPPRFKMWVLLVFHAKVRRVLPSLQKLVCLT